MPKGSHSPITQAVDASLRQGHATLQSSLAARPRHSLRSQPQLQTSAQLRTQLLYLPWCPAQGHSAGALWQCPLPPSRSDCELPLQRCLLHTSVLHSCLLHTNSMPLWTPVANAPLGHCQPCRLGDPAQPYKTQPMPSHHSAPQQQSTGLL
jgi:hypothetical protein